MDVKEALAQGEAEILQHAKSIARLLYERGVILPHMRGCPNNFSVIQRGNGMGVVEYCQITHKYNITIPPYVPDDVPLSQWEKDEERRDAQENDLEYMED